MAPALTSASRGGFERAKLGCCAARPDALRPTSSVEPPVAAWASEPTMTVNLRDAYTDIMLMFSASAPEEAAPVADLDLPYREERPGPSAFEFHIREDTIAVPSYGRDVADDCNCDGGRKSTEGLQELPLLQVCSEL